MPQIIMICTSTTESKFLTTLFELFHPNDGLRKQEHTSTKLRVYTSSKKFLKYTYC
jgi:hypothetical protein